LLINIKTKIIFFAIEVNYNLNKIQKLSVVQTYSIDKLFKNKIYYFMILPRIFIFLKSFGVKGQRTIKTLLPIDCKLPKSVICESLKSALPSIFLDY